MRLSTSLFLTMIVMLVPLQADQSAAQEEIAVGQTKAKRSYSLNSIEARLAFRQAQSRLHQYRYVDYPRQRRELDDAIKRTVAEIKVIERRILSYRPFRTVGRYSATLTSEQDYHLSLLATKQKLRQLKDQRIDHWRYHADRCRLLELEALRAAVVLKRD